MRLAGGSVVRCNPGMLEVMSGWLVQQPGHIALVAAGNLAVWALCRATVLRAAQGYNRLWVPAILWLAYAAWEWLVLVRTPDANIRVDLLLIWPVIALTTLWALGRAAMGWWKTRHR
jgi:hypothetical protein